jgi:hypothetical protein
VALRETLVLSKDRRTITGRFLCGGKLTATQTAREVTVTYVASSVGPGAMACALVPLSVHVAKPLTPAAKVVDGVTGQRLRVIAG